MAHLNATGIARYGLRLNPYTPRPLNPLTSEERLHSEMRAVRAVAEAETYVQRAARHDAPAFVLVAGKSGTGRTSVANHLLRHYRDIREIENPKLFVVPKSRFSGQDPFDILKQWLASLHTKLKRAGVADLGEEGFNFEEELSTRASLERDTYTTFLADFLPELAEVLSGSKQAAFGACFENLKDYSLARAAFEAFGETPTLVVFTVLEYPRREDSIRVLYERHVPEGPAAIVPRYPVVDLELMDGRDARELVHYHWTCATDLEFPFDPGGLQEGFDDRLRTAGRVLQLTEHVLDTHAATVGEGPLWPDAREELALRSDLLQRLLPQADKSVPEPIVSD